MLLKLFNWVISKKEATKIEILKLHSHQKKKKEEKKRQLIKKRLV